MSTAYLQLTSHKCRKEQQWHLFSENFTLQLLEITYQNKHRWAKVFSWLVCASQ